MKDWQKKAHFIEARKCCRCNKSIRVALTSIRTLVKVLDGVRIGNPKAKGTYLCNACKEKEDQITNELPEAQVTPGAEKIIKLLESFKEQLDDIKNTLDKHVKGKPRWWR